MLDAAAESAVNDAPLELPPEPFVRPSTLAAAYECMRPGGVCLVNVIAQREMMATVADRFEAAFDAVMVLAIDPNLLFVGFKRPFALPMSPPLPACDLADLVDAHGLHAPEIVGPILRRTEEFRQSKVLLGWVTLDVLRAAVADKEYRVL
jgi:hypothetical protein